MADLLKRFKPITSDDMFKGIDKSHSSAVEAYGGLNTPDDGGDELLTWHFVDRTSITQSGLDDDLKNLFHSFGISRDDENDWLKVFNVKDWFNAKRMIIISLPQSGCSTYIDGATIRINVPTGVTNANQFVSFYGSTFHSFPDPLTGKQLALAYEDSVWAGGAMCYLWGKTNGTNTEGNLLPGTYPSGANYPYTGNIDGGPNPNADIRDWDPSEASDNFVVSAQKKQNHYSASHWKIGQDGYDIPYGIAFLEKGIFIIFDFYGRDDVITSDLSGATIWEAQVSNFTAYTSTGASVQINRSSTNRQNIHFEGSIANVNAKVYYRTIDQAYKMIYFCHASQNEFNSTSNHTYNTKKAYFRPEEADSLWVTEIGLYDADDDLLAYAKLSEPVEKNKLETLTFKVELEL